MKYLIRSLKYFAALCVICAAIVGLMLVTRTTPLTPGESLYVMFHTQRGWLMLCTIAVLAALYPRFGFVCRRVEGDLTEHRTQIENAFRSAGFRLVAATDDELLFRAGSLPHRLLLLFEDEIRVTQYGQWIELDGIRRGVARVEYRLQSYIEQMSHE